MPSSADALTALGDPTRRAVFELLSDGPLAVVDLARRLPVSRPAVSQHLRVLKEAGFVIDRRDGRGRLYQLDPDGIGTLHAHFEALWNRAQQPPRSASSPTEGR